MASRIRLEKMKKVSPALIRAMEQYYSSLGKGVGKSLFERRQDMLKGEPSLICYRIRRGQTIVGWAALNGKNNTLLELMLKEPYTKDGVEPHVLDALVKKHHLIGALLPRADRRRRDFLEAYGFRPTRGFSLNNHSVVRMDLSTAVYLEKVKGTRTVHRQKMERVAVERIPASQTDEQIKAGLKKLLLKLGGLRRFVRRGQRVVLKPNLVSEHGLKDGVRRGGVATDIRVVRAMVEILLPVADKVIIAEGSSINRSETWSMFRHYGFDRLVELSPDKVSLVDLNRDEQVEKEIPGGRRVEKRKVPKTLIDADVVINMPVLKVHFAAGASLSIKNLQGAIPPLEKYKVHFFGLWQNLINTYKLIKPQLIILDGLWGQEDFGPISGTPKQMNLLIGGTNPVAVDTVALKIMGMEPQDSPPVVMAYQEGLGPMDMERIEVKGPRLADLVTPFRRPVIDVSGGKDFEVHEGEACPGCQGYLHFVLAKLRRPDPQAEGRLLIERPFTRKVNIFLGPQARGPVNPEETNIFMGICQQHRGHMGRHMPGCPPHAEEIINTIFALYPDVVRPKYADKTEEARLGEMLKEILESQAGNL